jgi:hypothetical protein
VSRGTAEPFPTRRAGFWSQSLCRIGLSAVILAGLSLPAATGAALTSVPTSAIAGGINAEPALRPWEYAGANPQSWWCRMPDCTADFDVDGQGPLPTIRAELADAKGLGARDVQEGFPWPLIEPARGVFDWTRADQIMQATRTVGIPILADLTFTPQWAGGGAMLNDPPADVSDWTTFVTAFADRYRADLGMGVEIWNEPDSGKSLYNGSALTYVTDILNPAYAAVKAVDANLPVIEAGSINDAVSCCKFLAAVIQDGGRFDVATFHNYSGTWTTEADAYRQVLDANGLSQVPLWMTEFGVDSRTGNQTTAIDQVFGGDEPLQMASWYNLRDTDAWACCPPADHVQGHWGLLSANFSAKPAYAVLQTYLGGIGAPTTPSGWLNGAAFPSALPSEQAPPKLSAQPSGRLQGSAGLPSWAVLALAGVMVLCFLGLLVTLLRVRHRPGAASRIDVEERPGSAVDSWPGPGHG